jgi:hypothetical protein
MPRPARLGLRLGLGLMLLIVGAATGLGAVAEYARWWGLALAVSASLLTVYAAPAGWPRCGYVVGWLVPLGLAQLGRPEGDWALVADVPGYLLLLVGVLLLTYAVATVPPPRRNAARSPQNGPSQP